MAVDLHHLLICTVGGTPEPIVAAIRHWKPARVLMVHSADTKSSAETVTRESGLLNPGNWDFVELHDAQDLEACVHRMRNFDDQVREWCGRGASYDVIVDFTGGTKCMSAAIALVARRWQCAFSYVGGTERTKGGTGIVVSGKELTLVTQNPWNALGYQSIEDACLLFDQHAFLPAAKLLDDARMATDDASVKRTLSTLYELCEGYGLWDRFQHAKAAPRIANALKNASDLQATFGSTRANALIQKIKHHQDYLQRLRTKPRSLAFVIDLLANARRRQDEARSDDAVARLYRAIEAVAQIALADRHEIPDTGKVPLDLVPEPLRERWKPRADQGTLFVGLQEAYALLDALGHPIGVTFKELGLHERASALTARNQSIWAHGFDPVGTVVFDQLWTAALRLGDGSFTEHDLPVFPRLAKAEQ